MKRGVIYVATGPDYLDLACQSAATLRASNPGIAADLFTDQENVPHGHFDRVRPVPVSHPRAKLDCLPLSRFDRTLFLDCDTLVVGDLGDVWALMDQFDMALAHDVRRASGLIREGLDERTPYAFPQFNSGVILYRKSPAVLDFMAEWKRLFQASGGERDQPVLKDLLWRRRDVRVHVLPPEFNLRRVTMFDAWEPLDAEVKIIHSHRLMDHMRRPGAPRLRTLTEILDAERDALLEEWRAAGVEPAGRAPYLARLKRHENGSSPD